MLFIYRCGKHTAIIHMQMLSICRCCPYTDVIHIHMLSVQRHICKKTIQMILLIIISSDCT